MPESIEKKGALVMKVKNNLISELRSLLFNNNYDISGGEEVRDLFKRFHDDVLKVSKSNECGSSRCNQRDLSSRLCETRMAKVIT